MSTTTTAEDLEARRSALEAELAALHEAEAAREKAQQARYAAAVEEWQARIVEAYPTYAERCEEVVRGLRDVTLEAAERGDVAAAVVAAQEESAVRVAQGKAYGVYSQAFDTLHPRPYGMPETVEERRRVEALPSKAPTPTSGWFDLTSVLERFGNLAGSVAARRGEDRFAAE